MSTQSAEQAVECYQIALKIYKAIHNAVSLRDACRSIYEYLDGVIILHRLFCIIPTEPFKTGHREIRYAAFIENGEERSLPPRRLIRDDLLKQVFIWGDTLSDEDKISKNRKLGSELSNTNHWILIPLVSSTEYVLGVLGFCRDGPQVFSDLEKEVFNTIGDAIAQFISIHEIIKLVKIRERELIIGELVGSVLHDIRNEFGTITFLVQGIEDELKNMDIQYPPKIDRFLYTIDQNARQIEAKAVEGMKEIKKPLTAPTVEAISVTNLIEESLKPFDNLRQQYNILTDFQPDVAQIQAYSRNILDAFRYVIQNGLQAMSESDKKHLSISVENWSDEQDKLWVKVEIIDTGHGINTVDLPKIWELSYSTKSPIGGFGLYWAKKVLEESNGTIDVKSQVNKGTTFTIKLPAVLGNS